MLPERFAHIPAPRRWKIAAWFAVVMAVLIWAAVQPPTRLEPVPWTGTLDF